ncbi:NAD(P)H-binding protein [Parvibaculum sp.]|uniref:NAD(P)H-binding protein n=1 Tax=Parvibaculum sp. TaxID=2024848 RepID=UPI001B19F994|nr:NAD(P)H-binding protein [Parvibaculum sp.]MBO6635951.1 NAD(P)H-binding protein [Parvibaculum sp.]MBO6678575.1 NAD(P)H-binding protein [Parvibaculum sp.]MBO6684084.1 NAD(P)H-binding protein [Parvibaculum sp.]MBO6903768.1 NAD(P)H-binding protein [Parvibaculum sp.]
MTDGRTALVAGATGLVGGHLVRQLIADASCRKLVTLTRRPPEGVASPKLNGVIADFGKFDVSLTGVAADDAYCALGTTIKTAGSQAAFYTVDHDYIVAFANAAKAAGAKRFMLVSAIGADATSSIFYSRVKGETERDVEALGFEALHIFRPGLLLGERAERRTLEGIGMGLAPYLNPLMLGPARVYRSIPAATVAGAMRGAAASGLSGRHVHTYDAMIRLAGL